MRLLRNLIVACDLLATAQLPPDAQQAAQLRAEKASAPARLQPTQVAHMVRS